VYAVFNANVAVKDTSNKTRWQMLQLPKTKSRKEKASGDV
jgi:hypothetical protein